ncbi:hypothetical protein QR680_006489 [Steinernema hermaphroditum]|uniref:Uncharacterized protein n=1 Tax=Steinernema hermaphroditum TaxID=289476 RepID=A0AA39LWN3_9BILA|nr:hypothetical protein QR680_006489 [Steinernema hermaphroditum]
MSTCGRKRPFCGCCSYPNCLISCLLGSCGNIRGWCGASQKCVDRRIYYHLLISEDEGGISVTRTIFWNKRDISISKFELESADSLWQMPEMERCKQIRCSQMYITSNCFESFKYEHLDRIARIVEGAPMTTREKLDRFGITLSLKPDDRIINRMTRKLPIHMRRIELNFPGEDQKFLNLVVECLKLSPKLIKTQCSDLILESVLDLMENNYDTKLWLKVNFPPARPFTAFVLMESLQTNWQNSNMLHQNGVEIQFSAPLSTWDLLPAENYLYKSNKTKKFAPMYAQMRCIFEKQETGVFGRIALYMGLEGKENKSLGFGVKARY